MRSIGELLYLLLVIGGFAVFAVVLVWVQETWRPALSKESADSKRVLPRAAE